MNLKVEDVSSALAANVPARLIDLLEIAAYVFAADQAASRGGPRDAGKKWRRRFAFQVPVREPEWWSRTESVDALSNVLGFLSEDDFEFSFSRLQTPPEFQAYLDLGAPAERVQADRVMLFSGGVDSLGGAVQSTLVEKSSVVLVSHRSGPKRVPIVDQLARELTTRAAPRAVTLAAVWATKSENVGREFTQRTRSFLYGAIATTVSAMLGLDRIFFYENGVTSVNLPVAGQVVGARATRTTHPQAVRGLAGLYGLILDRPFSVETPFLWMTKSDVMRLLKANGCGDLVAHTVSCSRTVEATKLNPHCGRCSQCIDRRFAALAAGLTDDEDPPEAYAVDLFTGERAYGEDRTMVETFVQRARTVNHVSDTGFFQEYPEATRVLRHTGAATGEAARRMLALHRRHAAEIDAQVTEGLRRHAEQFEKAELPESCLLALTVPDRYRGLATVGGRPKEPAFLREGSGWHAWFEHEEATLKDWIGMRYIAYLLRSPGYEFHCAELKSVAAGEALKIPVGAADAMATVGSIRSRRKRLAGLKEEIEAAKDEGNTERLLVLKEELDSTTSYLRSVTGFGGVPRNAADENEDARKAVSVAICRALQQVDGRIPPLGRHLRRFLDVGVYVLYRPDPRVDWTIQL